MQAGAFLTAMEGEMNKNTAEALLYKIKSCTLSYIYTEIMKWANRADGRQNVKAQPLQCVSEAGNHLWDAGMATKLCNTSFTNSSHKRKVQKKKNV